MQQASTTSTGATVDGKGKQGRADAGSATCRGGATAMCMAIFLDLVQDGIEGSDGYMGQHVTASAWLAPRIDLKQLMLMQ